MTNKDRINSCQAHGGTYTVGAIQKTLKQFSGNAKKILLVVTDGQDDIEGVRDILQKNRDVINIGIGLETDLSRSYTNHVNTTIEELPVELINKLRRVI